MRLALLLIASVLVLSALGADQPKRLWEHEWDRRSFQTTMIMLRRQAQDDGKVSDQEFIAIATAGFRLLEPDDPKRRFVTRIREEKERKVVYVALDDGMTATGYDFWFLLSGKFEKLEVVPSQ